ncbi:MAG: CpaD family pilus assembly lipoprotein [Pacificimonas sp.]|jgi:pilus assembly protein CpaD|nr:CpaD family pilus assembly lipoprotein [Pacificimonas sp.]
MTRFLKPVLAFGIAGALAACGGPQSASNNQTPFNLNTPVVTQHLMTYDLIPPAGQGLSAAQRDELREWLNSIDVRYGDRVSVDQEAVPAAFERREQVATILGERGMMLNRLAPVTSPALPAGATRVVVVRAKATVPDCPNHSSVDDLNYDNATSSNYGCADSTALSQMIADPNDLVRGKPYKSDRLDAVIPVETGPGVMDDY